MVLKTVGKEIFLNTFAAEVYLPYEYLTSEYRGFPYYSILGTKLKYFAIGNMRIFETEKAYNDPMSVDAEPLGIPMLIVSEPSEIDTRDVRFTKTGPLRRCIVLTYKRNDKFMVNTDAIKSLEAVMMTLQRLEGGKFDHLPPDVVVTLIRDAEKMNGLNLRIPSEELEIYVAERYRDPNNPDQKARFSNSQNKDKILTYNMREEAMQTTTYQALTHEDVNSSLITSINRKREGVVDEPTVMERIIRGMDMSMLYDKEVLDGEKDNSTR